MKTFEALGKVLKGKRLEPVFKQRSGGFYQDGDGLGHRVRYVVERAGIKGKKVGVHTLRHSSASLVAREGKPLIVKSLLQHDDIKTSMRYIHDAEELVVGDDRYSPLRLLGEHYRKFVDGDGVIKVEQLQLTEGERIGESVALVPVSTEVIAQDDIGDLVGDMFPKIVEGVAVRMVLK